MLFVAAQHNVMKSDMNDTHLRQFVRFLGRALKREEAEIFRTHTHTQSEETTNYANAPFVCGVHASRLHNVDTRRGLYRELASSE